MLFPEPRVFCGAKDLRWRLEFPAASIGPSVILPSCRRNQDDDCTSPGNSSIAQIASRHSLPERVLQVEGSLFLPTHLSKTFPKTSAYLSVLCGELTKSHCYTSKLLNERFRHHSCSRLGNAHERWQKKRLPALETIYRTGRRPYPYSYPAQVCCLQPGQRDLRGPAQKRDGCLPQSVGNRRIKKTGADRRRR